MNARERPTAPDAVITPDTSSGPEATPTPDTPKGETKETRPRRSTDELIAEAEQKLAALKEQRRRELAQAREEHDRRLRALLKSAGLDAFSIEAWTSAAEEIKKLLVNADKK